MPPSAHPRVEYRCAPAEAAALPDASVDLAVAAQAAHWFDWPRYVAEVARVARPGRAGRAGQLRDPASSTATPTRSSRATTDDDVGPYWPPGASTSRTAIAISCWPWPAVEAPAIEMTAEWTRDELLGYVGDVVGDGRS